MGCHLRFGFEAQCGRDTVALRDDNVADYPVAVLRARGRDARVRPRIADGGTSRTAIASVIEEALLNGLTADARAFVGVPPASLSDSDGDRTQFLDAVHERTRRRCSTAFERYRPTETAYSPLSFFFNFSHNVVKGTVVDALLWGEAWDVSLNDLLTGVPRAGLDEGSQQLLATTLDGLRAIES